MQQESTTRFTKSNFRSHFIYVIIKKAGINKNFIMRIDDLNVKLYRKILALYNSIINSILQKMP